MTLQNQLQNFRPFRLLFIFSFVLFSLITNPINTIASTDAGQKPTNSAPSNNGNASFRLGSSVTQGSGGINDLLGKVNSGSLVNEFTGKLAFNLNLGGVVAQNGISYSLNLSYYGAGLEPVKSLQDVPGSWVGAGFSLKPASITVVSDDVLLSGQRYYLSLDGVSQQEMIEELSTGIYRLKNNPYVSIFKNSVTTSITQTDRCTAGTTFTSSIPKILGWRVSMPDGTVYTFGDDKNCDDSQYKLCVRSIGRYFKYSPFYSSTPDNKIPQVYFLASITDRQNKAGIWFNYNKVTENVAGRCNSFSTVPSFQNNLDRAVYLSKIYSTNGPHPTDYITSQITLNTQLKTEESIVLPSRANPMGFYEDQKLNNLQYFENGILTNTLTFSYSSTTAPSRMILTNLTSQSPLLLGQRNILTVNYYPGAGPVISSFSDVTGKIVEVSLGNVVAGAFASGSPFYQELKFNDPNTPDGYPPPGTKIAFARQIGNKYYIETENWSGGCLSSADTRFVERLYEFENKGTYWGLKRTIMFSTPTCPTFLDFFMSPDGKYFIWSYPGGDGTTNAPTHFDVRNLTTDDAVPPSIGAFDFPYVNGLSRQTQLYLYPDWFAATNPGQKNHISFYHKPSATSEIKQFVEENCGSGSGINNSLFNPNNSNYSGENENVSQCLTFGSGGLNVYPGPGYLAVDNSNLGILHVFGYDGSTIRDYVQGIESTHFNLPAFTPVAGNPPFSPNIPRPWFRQYPNIYHNNSDHFTKKIVTSENFIMQLIGGDNGISYLLVLGYDGNKLRYLYDEPIFANFASSDPNDEVDFAAGPDYFLVKNHSPGAATINLGIFFYKVDLNMWTVAPRTTLLSSDGQIINVTNEDYIMKAYTDYIFIEKLANLKGPEGYSSLLTRDGLDNLAVPLYNPNNTYTGASYVYTLNTNRDPIYATTSFRTVGSNKLNLDQVNFTTNSTRLLSCDFSFVSTGQSNFWGSGKYNLWSHIPTDPTIFVQTSLPIVDPVDVYHSATLVTGGTMVTAVKKTATEESLKGLYFYPDPSTPIYSLASSQFVPGDVIVSSIKIKNNGVNSTGNQVQEIKFTYPQSSPEAVPAKIVMNYQSGVPNFKYVKKEFSEGAQVSEFIRDEELSPLPKINQTLIGAPSGSWTLPDKVSYQKPGSLKSTSVLTPYHDPQWKSEATVISKPQETTKTYFYQTFLPSVSYSSNIDFLNGQPKVTVAKVAGRFNVTLSIYAQDLQLTALPSTQLLRQTATFQFASDPCTDGGLDHCSNLNAGSFTPDQMKSILSSTIYTYDAAFRLQDVYQWQPVTLGTVYPPLNGDPTQPPAGSGWSWLKVSSVTKRQDHAVARCQSDLVTESNQLGVYTTHFYGGNDCYPIGTVSNSPLFATALLNGEEEIKTENCPGNIPCMGAFGRWQSAGSSLQQDPVLSTDPPKVVHTGNNAVKVTSIYGPTINLKIRQDVGFMESQKGYMVSVWMLAKPNSNPAAAIEFRKSLMPTSPDSVVYSIDLVQEYIASNGPFPTNKWIKLQRLISYSELSSHGVFLGTPSNDYLRIWFGKSSSATTNPVYVDDVRLYPANASVNTTNFDSTGLVSSTLDANNEPTFIEYDVWRNPVGARNKDGILSSSSTTKLFSE